jgi:pSer/pThr/pTyr-binding forkhead associated (FHA) protein
MIEGVELIIRREGYPDRVETLEEGDTRLGRAQDNEIVLSDVAVSRRHAQISISAYEVHIEDLGSGNGIYYNGHRVNLQVLGNGDEVVIDPFTLIFRLVGEDLDTFANAPDRPSSRARLEVITGQGMAGSSYSIRRNGLTIGRSEKRDIVIPDAASSRHHATISMEDGKYMLTDADSANGMFVNNERIRAHELNPGDVIKIGNTELRFVLYDANEHEQETDLSRVVPQEILDHPTEELGKSRVWLAILFVLAVSGLGITCLIVGVSLLFYFQGG